MAIERRYHFTVLDFAKPDENRQFARLQQGVTLAGLSKHANFSVFSPSSEFLQSRRERKKIEMRFAHLKRILKLGRLRLRGPRGAQDEFVLAAIAQNLRRLASLVARPPPAQALCTA
jgi:hypothetical protein